MTERHKGKEQFPGNGDQRRFAASAESPRRHDEIRVMNDNEKEQRASTECAEIRSMDDTELEGIVVGDAHHGDARVLYPIPPVPTDISGPIPGQPVLWQRRFPAPV